MVPLNAYVPEPLRAALRERRAFGGQMQVAAAAAILAFLRSSDDDQAAALKRLREWMDEGCPESGVISADDRRRKPSRPAKHA